MTYSFVISQSAVVGSRVILPCRVEGKSGQLQWTKDDFGLGTHRHLNGYERYRMIGSDEEGKVIIITSPNIRPYIYIYLLTYSETNSINQNVVEGSTQIMFRQI